MGRLGNYKEEIETPMSEQEKTDFVSGKFLYAITDFSLFKRGEAYWLEYIGNDTYCCRSDNRLNEKIKINPWELKRYFSEEPLHPFENILSEFAYHVRTWGLTDGESNMDFCKVEAHRWVKEMIKTRKKPYIDRVFIKIDDIIFLPKLKRKHSKDLWHVSDDPENGRLIISVYEIDKMYLERVTDALAIDDIYRWCYVDDLL